MAEALDGTQWNADSMEATGLGGPGDWVVGCTWAMDGRRNTLRNFIEIEIANDSCGQRHGSFDSFDSFTV